MGWFKVLSGGHRGEDGKDYSKGEVVESRHDLVALFGEKFEATDKPKSKPIRVENIPAPPLSPAETVDSDESSNEPEGEEETGGESVETITSTLGEDVTSKFDKAVAENDLAVVRDPKTKKYFVVDRDTPNAALNTEDLTSITATAAFLGKKLNG